MKTYRLLIVSCNSTTTVLVDLTKKEVRLFDDITKSLSLQKAVNTLYIKEVK